MKKIGAFKCVVLSFGIPALVIQSNMIADKNWYGAVLMIMTVPGLLMSLAELFKGK